MSKIEITSTEQICDLFNLLKIDDAELTTELESLIELDFQKNKAVDENNFDLAAKIRIDELIQIKKTIELLNLKGHLEQNTLTIQVK